MKTLNERKLEKQEELIKALVKRVLPYELSHIELVNLNKELAALDKEVEEKESKTCYNCEYLTIGYGKCVWCIHNSDTNKNNLSCVDNWVLKSSKVEQSTAEEILDEVKVFLLKIKTLTDSKLLYDQCDKLYNKLHFMEYAQSQKPSRDEIRSIIINAPCHFEEAEVERFTDYLFDELLKPVI
jgi:radical SAM protein with 4Fe4S-binding SPASM domain